MRKLVFDKKSIKRFHNKYVIDSNKCWVWQAFIRSNGYGQFSQPGRQIVYAHRWSYFVHKGEIPKGMVIDHLCRVRHCVNPKHLQMVSQKVNINRGESWARSKSHCPQGHEYNDNNTYLIPGKNHRLCRECRRVRNREQQRRIRDAKKEAANTI